MSAPSARGRTPCPRFVLAAVLVVARWSCDASPAAAQTIPHRPAARAQSALPVVPPSESRPLEGLGPGEQLDEQPSLEPVASFIDSLKANDAAIEVIVGQGRLLTLKKDLAGPAGTALVAVGDPSMVEFEILPNPRMIRLAGLRAGVTDMSITTADGDTVGFEIYVVYDLELLRAQLRQLFPSAQLRLAQLREHIVVEGQARSPEQVTRIVETIDAYLGSVQMPGDGQAGQATPAGFEPEAEGQPTGEFPADSARPDAAFATGEVTAGVETGSRPSVRATFARPQVINLIRVPGVQQVLLKVRIAELNRTAMREVGADILVVDPNTGNIVGTQIGGAIVEAMATAGLGGLVGEASNAIGDTSTAFGIFPSGDWDIILRLLRQNSLVKILAEPNLIAMTGHRANFLAGGEFPVPVSQQAGATPTVQYKSFGVQLDFLPTVLDDERIRLSVTPEVSTVDEALGTVLVVGGTPIPGVNTRRATTVVELREGQTLALAGLLQVELDGQTNRIPLLGDLPIIGPLFSNTSHSRTERELLVMVTPYLVQPMERTRFRRCLETALKTRPTRNSTWEIESKGSQDEITVRRLNTDIVDRI